VNVNELDGRACGMSPCRDGSSMRPGERLEKVWKYTIIYSPLIEDNLQSERITFAIIHQLSLISCVIYIYKPIKIK
jgi:hypothetical protein